MMNKYVEKAMKKLEERKLPCGGHAIPDKSGEIHDGEPVFSRCSSCFAVVGSVGMPQHCKELLEKENENV